MVCPRLSLIMVFVLPSEVINATQVYREDSDPLGQFLSVAVKDEIGEESAIYPHL